jgi:signal transduction histidine kinase
MGRPRLRTLLLLTYLVVLALPLAGFWFLRLYESALVRQTESELVAQAAVLSGAWRAARGDVAPDGTGGLPALSLDAVRRGGLDLARDPVLQPAPDARPVPAGDPAADPRAAAIGARIAPVLRDAQPVTLAGMRMLDASGVVVATTGGDLGLSLAGLEEVEAARRGEPATVMRRREKVAEWVPGGFSRTATLRVHVALPVMAGGRVDAVVLLSRTPASVTQTVAGKVREIGLVAALLLAAVVGLAVLASRLVTRPIAGVVRAAQSAAAGANAALPPLPRGAVREAAELSDAIARMAAAAERRAGYLRDLAAHVSHEFKTPLAGIRGAAELLADHGEAMSPAERARFVGAVEDGVARLEGLVRGLLDLARADMAGASEAVVALGPIARAAAGRAASLRVTVEGEARARARAPAEAVAGVLSILLDNVATHAGPGTAVRVTLGERGGEARMAVADDGPGLSPANAARAFDPFFTTGRERGGTGLGLPIARSLVERAGGRIALASSDRGACFEVAWPGGAGAAGAGAAGAGAARED